MNNVVYNTRGYVVDGATFVFSGNSWGLPQNAGDIALPAGVGLGRALRPAHGARGGATAAPRSATRGSAAHRPPPSGCGARGAQGRPAGARQKTGGGEGGIRHPPSAPSCRVRERGAGPSKIRGTFGERNGKSGRGGGFSAARPCGLTAMTTPSTPSRMRYVPAKAADGRQGEQGAQQHDKAQVSRPRMLTIIVA